MRVGDDVYIRSAYGPENPWLVRARASGAGRLTVAGHERDVGFEVPSPDVDDEVSAAYRAKSRGGTLGPVRLWVGTSGFHYAHWRRVFYPAGLPTERWLAFYAERFLTVELNAPFYRLPPRRTFEGWARSVPDGFRFAVKVSRYLTHVLRLREPEEPMQRLLDRCSGLGHRLGPLLLQLPPDLEVAPDRLSDVLERLPADIRLAVEPRHDSWWNDEIEALLRSRHVALCWADRRGPISPTWATADWRYLRYHEGRGEPSSCYRPRELRPWIERLAADAGRIDDAWIYFNNDPFGCAVRDATELMRRARDAGLDVVG